MILLKKHRSGKQFCQPTSLPLFGSLPSLCFEPNYAWQELEKKKEKIFVKLHQYNCEHIYYFETKLSFLIVLKSGSINYMIKHI